MRVNLNGWLGSHPLWLWLLLALFLLMFQLLRRDLTFTGLSLAAALTALLALVWPDHGALDLVVFALLGGVAVAVVRRLGPVPSAPPIGTETE